MIEACAEYDFPEGAAPEMPEKRCYTVDDLMLILEGKSLKQVAEFVSNKLSVEDEVMNTKTHFILKRYKDHGTVMERKHKDKRDKVTA